MKKYLKKENIFTAVFILIALHSFIELDYLAYGFLDSIHMPRLTTIINFILFPLLVVLAFYYFDQNKKRTLTLFVIYAFLFGIYFILHCKSAAGVIDRIYLPGNFYFSFKSEVVYFITLLLPLVYIYVFNLTEVREVVLEKISIAVSLTTALPIFLANLFVFGFSTYEGNTIANLFSWFSLPFDDKLHQPRFYASKFFFEEGNPIGILLMMTLPLLYYFFYQAGSKKKKTFLGSLIIIQSIAMIVLSTRVATFGSVIVPVMMALIYLVLLLLKKESLHKPYLVFVGSMCVVTGVFMPFCPAYQNQLIDAKSYEFQKVDNDYLESQRGLAKMEVDLDEWSEEWLNYYSYMFEQYAFLVHVTPPVYYMEIYPYKYDPKFWVDLIFDYPLEERVDGRQIETIFTKYKFEQLTPAEKGLGMGYSTFMWGSILIERDFVQQFYTLGAIGCIFTVGIWIVLLLYAALKLITQYQKWSYLNVVLMMISCIGIGSSLVSGHTLDKLTTGMMISLVLGVLISRLRKGNGEAKEA